MPLTEGKKIILGSGKIYISEYTDEIPVDATLEVAANELGDVSGGATLEYKPTYYTAEDDLQVVSKTVITAEEVTLKSGVMTWNGKTLKSLSSTARVTEAAGKRTVKIGGLKNHDGKKYVVRFVNTDPEYGKTRVTIVGSNQNGFTLAFVKDKEVVVDAEFRAQSMDAEGTKVIFEEEIPST